jgi:hypothetical protein
MVNLIKAYTCLKCPGKTLLGRKSVQKGKTGLFQGWVPGRISGKCE